MKINFLEIYDVTELFTNGIKDKYSPPYTHMYIQQDVWDFQVFRIQKGDYEGNDDVYTVENALISKADVLEEMGRFRSGKDVRSAFESLNGYNVFKKILEIDAENGYENEDYATFESNEEAYESVIEDYTVHPVAFISESLKETI